MVVEVVKVGFVSNFYNHSNLLQPFQLVTTSTTLTTYYNLYNTISPQSPFILLKNVKPLFLKDKRITLPVEISRYRHRVMMGKEIRIIKKN